MSDLFSYLNSGRKRDQKKQFLKNQIIKKMENQNNITFINFLKIFETSEKAKAVGYTKNMILDLDKLNEFLNDRIECKISREIRITECTSKKTGKKVS